MSLNPAEQSDHSLKALGNLLEKVTPWLLEVGGWIFGGLIACNLLVLAAIMNIRPLDAAILIAITALACALPLNVTGLLMLRLVRDMQNIGFDDLTVQAFRDSGFPNLEAYIPALPERQKRNLNKVRAALCCAFGIAAFTTLLTLAGLVAALWHIAWWIGAAVVATAIVCLVLVGVVLGTAGRPQPEPD